MGQKQSKRAVGRNQILFEFVRVSQNMSKSTLFLVKILILILSKLVTENFNYLQLSRIIVCVHKNSRETQIQLLSNLVNEQ